MGQYNSPFSCEQILYYYKMQIFRKIIRKINNFYNKKKYDSLREKVIYIVSLLSFTFLCIILHYKNIYYFYPHAHTYTNLSIRC